MALGVKGKWEEHNDGGQDDPSQPETAHVHKIHNGAQNRYR
jgi:hypothetical protein